MQEISNKPIIYNKDIKASNNPWLLPLVSANESKIQQTCKRFFDTYASSIEMQYKRKLLEFVHIDNGSKSGIRHKIRKKAEGTRAGFPDVMIIASKPDYSQRMVMFLEFKRISTPSSIKIKDNQINYVNWLSTIGFEAMVLNNPLYFEKHILLDRIQNFILGR